MVMRTEEMVMRLASMRLGPAVMVMRLVVKLIHPGERLRSSWASVA